MVEKWTPDLLTLPTIQMRQFGASGSHAYETVGNRQVECYVTSSSRYDAGDHVKFGLPMAWSTTTLAWGMISYKDAYKDRIFNS